MTCKVASFSISDGKIKGIEIRNQDNENVTISVDDDGTRTMTQLAVAAAATLRQLAAEADRLADAVPVPGSVWRHSSGRVYRVMLIANRPNDERYPLTVVYEDASAEVWTRRADDWHRSMAAITAPDTTDNGKVRLGGYAPTLPRPKTPPIPPPSDGRPPR